MGHFTAESDGVSMKIEKHRDRYLAAKIRKAVSEREGDASDALSGIKITIKQAVSDGRPTELAMETDVQTVFLKNPGLHGDG
jgi:hypothetical protein